MQIKGDTIVCRIFHHVACFGCGKGIATSYDGEKAVRKMAREAGAKKMLIGDGDPIKQWYCKSCAADRSGVLSPAASNVAVGCSYEKNNDSQSRMV